MINTKNKLSCVSEETSASLQLLGLTTFWGALSGGFATAAIPGVLSIGQGVAVGCVKI